MKNSNTEKSDHELIVTEGWKEPVLMNIYALRGHRVMVTEESAGKGYEFQRDLVKKHLKIGKIYLVEKTIVNGWNSQVFLQGFPYITFNTVNFVDAEPQSEEDDKKHPDWAMFNQ
jgi:hypothetical protein